MRISRQSIQRRISLADLINKARTRPNRSLHRSAIAIAAIILIVRTFRPHHTTSDADTLSTTQPSLPAPSLRASKQIPDKNSYPFFYNIDDSYIPPISKYESIPDAAFTVFYNLFIPKETSGGQYAISVMMEQLGQVAESLKRLEDDTKQKNAVLYYNLIGKPFPPSKMQQFCHSLHPRLQCKLIGFYNQASESVTLQSIHEFCSAKEDVRVTYIHSKGSYHHTEVNKNWRRELTNAVLHPQCLNPPDGACNVCGTSFFTRFAFMYPGNMWTAKCSYIKRLLSPKDGGEYDVKKKESIVNFLKMRLYGTLDATLLDDRIDYFGLGRYRLEHWIGSHPSILPCEIHRTDVDLGDMVSGKVNATSDYEWGMGPRREWVVPEIEGADDHLKSDEAAAFKEYYLLAGNLLKWFTLYGSDGVPSIDSWIWKYFPAGNRWKDLVTQYGANAVIEMTRQSTNELYSAYDTNVSSTTANKTFSNNNKLAVGSKPPVVVFYHIAFPKDRKKEAQYSLKVQLDVLANGQYDIQTRTFDHERETIIYYTIAEGDSFNVDFISKYCNRKKQNTTCHLLNEIPSANARGETLTQLYNYCQANPSSRVTYLTNIHPPVHGSNVTVRHQMQRLRTYATAVTSKMCLKSRDACNVCGMEFYALPYLHFSGNSFTADCEYVNKLMPPRLFETSMNKIAGETLVAHLERSFTTELFAFTPQNLGLYHYSVEHWIGSHPDIKPCDVAPVKKSWIPWFRSNAYIANDYSSSRIYDFLWGVAPRRSHAPIGTLAKGTERAVREEEASLFREYFYLAGNLFKWNELGLGHPSEESWVWKWFPGGDIWKKGVALNGSAVINEFTLKYADPNQGVPF